MSGSGGDTGYDYQANAIAYVAAHGLSGQPLAWFDDQNDVPATWLVETGGPGDDIRVITDDGLSIEIQAKHGLQRGEEYDSTFLKLIKGLQTCSQLRGVLLTDRHASQIIRGDLKQDIVRLGQGRTDGIKLITQDLLDELKKHGLADIAVFARLRICVVDLDDGADGVAVTQTLLSPVVGANNSRTAYDLLGKRGHGMIKDRGRDNVHKCASFLQNTVGLTSTGASPAISATRFAEWARSSNETFYSPAVQRHFPIHYAWAQVVPMDKRLESQIATTGTGADRLEREIKRYQEWARLTRDRRDIDALAADAFVESYRLSVIVGGPGSGKTTLSKWLAFLASQERLAVRVRLPTVAAILADGSTFERALVEAGIDSSGWTISNGKLILASADLLIADGLDECDPRRADVAGGLSRWAASHFHTSICVLTRPVGHSPALLPGFSHAELLPLDTSAIHKIASWMIASLCDPERAPTALSEFMNAVEERSQNDVASIAARNPLLLSFLVRLFLDGQPINGKRTVLFRRIVELIRKSPPLERRSLQSDVDYATAWAAAEVAAWSCVNKPDRPVSEVYSLIAEKLGGGIDAARRAESAIHQWTEHGLIERLTAGSLDGLVFVHFALAEYLAGRHLAQLDAVMFSQAIIDGRRKAKWREPILLAAGNGEPERVIDTLLSLDSPDDPESTEAMLAAAALAESGTGGITRSKIEIVAGRLKSRLCSLVPLIAIEAGLAMVDLAPLVPDLVGTIAIELWDHKQEWTRLAAVCAGLAGGSSLIPVSRIVEWIEQFSLARHYSVVSEYPEWPAGTYDLQNSALPKALHRIANELPPATAEKIVTTFLARPHITMGMSEAIAAELKEKPYSDWVYASRLKWIDSSAGLLLAGAVAANTALSAAEELLLSSIIRSCGREHNASSNQQSEYRLVGTLLSSMGFWELTARDLAHIGAESAAPLIEILRGMRGGLNLNADLLSDEANALLNRLRSSQILGSSEHLLLIAQIKREPDWNRVRGTNPDVNLLAVALRHESRFVAWNAARIFEQCSGAPSRRELLRDVLVKGQGHALFLVGILADAVWGEDAFEILHERLDGQLCLGCGYLYEPMLQAARDTEKVRLGILIALNGVAFDNPRIAELAAEALRVVDPELLIPHRDRVRELLDYWKRRGSWCEQCKKAVLGSSCEKCHTVPPEPRKHLIYLLFKAGALTFQDLWELAKEEGYGTADEARKALVHWAFADSSIMRGLIEQIDTGSAPGRLLNELLDQPVDQLKQNSDELLTILHSSFAAVRARLIDSFSSGWIVAHVARDLAQKALKDDSPLVRSAGAKFLRTQSQI